MKTDKRRAERIKTNLDVGWEGVLTKQTGTISDLSTAGCFILTGGEVTKGELISIQINLPSLLYIEVWGNVVYMDKEIGFAVRFRDFSATQRTLLARVIEHLRAKRT